MNFIVITVPKSHTMKLHLSLFYVIAFAIITSLSSFKTLPNTNTLDYGGWSKLGTQTVSEGAYYDVLDIAEEKAGIKRMKLKIQKKSIHLMSVKIVYKDGTSETHTIRKRLDKGDSTRALDLIGHYRIIQKIMFTYNGNSNKGGAQLVVLAKS